MGAKTLNPEERAVLRGMSRRSAARAFSAIALDWGLILEEATKLAIDETQVDLARGFLDGMRQLAVAQD